MQSLTLFASTLDQVYQLPDPPLPPRAYQPTLVEHGIDGELQGGSLNGEPTPDGLKIGSRRAHTSTRNDKKASLKKLMNLGVVTLSLLTAVLGTGARASARQIHGGSPTQVTCDGLACGGSGGSLDRDFV
jgi:hypothetical protein